MPQSEWSLDRLPVGIWVASAPDGVAVYANEAFRDILGTGPSPEAVIGEAPVVYGICDHAGRAYPIDRLPFSRVIATGGPVEVDDIMIQRPDGRRVYVKAMAAPTFDAGGRISHVTVAFTDISREIHAERARAVLETRLSFAVEHAPIVIFATDREGRITLAQGAGLAPLGHDTLHLVGRDVRDLYADHPTLLGYLARALAGESLWYTAEFGAVTYETWLAPRRDERGEVVEVCGVSTDVTELRKLQAAAIQNDRATAMGALAASVAHEINNPLTYVMMAIDGIQRGLGGLGTPDGMARIDEHLATARAGLERIASITADLKTFSRPDDTRREPLLLRDVVAIVMRLAAKSIEAHTTLALELADAPAVLANQARLVQVVMNLLGNALYAVRDLGDHARVVLRTGRDDDGHAILEVEDNGAGIPGGARERERIFEPFVTTKPVGDGTGLGLFVCRNLIKELGGRIEVRDRAGGGSVFRVTLPSATAQRAPAPTPPPVARPADAPKSRILIVDDEPLVGQALAASLRADGYDADSIADGAAALRRLLDGAPYDLVLCDLMMPGTTGMDIAEALAGRRPDVLDRVVFMTGGAFTPRAVAFLESSAYRCLSKPFRVSAEVARLLQRA